MHKDKCYECIFQGANYLLIKNIKLSNQYKNISYISNYLYQEN